MNTITTLTARIDELALEVAAKQDEVAEFDITDHIGHDQYDDMLDECCDEVTIGNLTYSPSQVLKAVDPVAYRIGYSEYCDSVELEEIPAYRDLQTQLEYLEAELEGAQEDLAELEEGQE